MQSSVSPLLPDWLTRCAENMPGHLAVRCGQTCWSFAELAGQAARLARQLAAAGVRAQSRVALLASNGLAYVATVHALTRLGAVLVPLNTRLTRDELCWQLLDVRAELLVGDDSMLERANQLVASIPELPLAILRTASPAPGLTEVMLHYPGAGAYPEGEIGERTLVDLAMIQAIIYTSGTTGKPKGVLITYGMQWWNAAGSALNLGHSADDCWLACLPLFHIGGLSILIRSVIYGISVVLLEKFDEIEVNRAICQERVTIISVVAVMLQRMLVALEAQGSEARYPASLRCVLLGGGPAPRPLLEQCADRAIPVAQTYGLTESCSQAVTLAPADALRKPGSAGRPLASVQLQIRQDGRILPANEPGIIYLKGPTITPGYADRPTVTAQAVQEGWLCTGDVGYLDADGYLYVLDRRSDLIISGGENIYPAEVESVLLAYPDVAEVGVCGQNHPQWGQIPVAFVKLHPGCMPDAESILEYARQRLARYKVPRMLYFVEELPRNSSGKLLRRELSALLPPVPS
ncbi:MAG TPA: o-succinylbenzoate--CoA ligase [Ktedonobacteraceae bacterium]|nr:o-succinylbenzoate--CoA ligase [Ktedonobacteraceae bacterium]